MAKYIRVIHLDDDSPAHQLFEAPSGKTAIKAALEELQSVVGDGEGLTSAIVLVGEGTTVADCNWLGGWVWRGAEGFVWTQPD